MTRLLLVFAVVVSSFAQNVDWLNQLKRKPFIDAREFSWSRTSGLGASGTLSSAGAVSITLTPCPRGLEENITWAYISGGTGTAEAMQITSLSETTGSCTIGGTTNNTHTGAWTVASANGGFQEAINYAQSVGTVHVVQLPGGNTTAYATIIIAGTDLVVRGEQHNTTITAANTLSPVIQVGTSTLANHIWLDGIHVTRTGTPPASSVGVHWKYFSYCGQNNLTVRNHAIGEKFGSTTSLGFDSIATQIDTASEAYLLFENAIEVSFHGGYLGVNAGGSTDSPTKAIIFKGITDTIKFNGTSIIPRGASTQWIGSFETFTSTNGVIYFDNVNSENIAGGFTSDASTAIINELTISNSRISLGATAPLFSFNAATDVEKLYVTDNSSLYAQINLTNPTFASITGNFITGSGGTLTGGAQAHLVFSNNTVVAGITFTGAWENLTLGHNVWYNSTPTISATAGATGGIQIVGNTSDIGTVINKMHATQMLGYFTPVTITRSDLAALTDASYPNGSIFYCSDCAKDATCTAGSGAFAAKVNGAVTCTH